MLRSTNTRIVYNRKKDASDAWQRALAVKDATLGVPDSFYEEELDQVILAQGVTSKDEYRVARRAGRGVVLTRRKRDAIWPVFEEYRAQLASRKLKEVDDAYRDAAALLSKGGRRCRPHTARSSSMRRRTSGLRRYGFSEP